MRSSAFFVGKLQTYRLKSHLRNSIFVVLFGGHSAGSFGNICAGLSYGSLDIPPSLLGLTCEG